MSKIMKTIRSQFREFSHTHTHTHTDEETKVRIQNGNYVELVQ